MTPEEILAKLKSQGIEPNQWQGVEPHLAGAAGVQGIVEGLTKLRDMLEGLAEADRKKIVELRTQAQRMTRGGGR